MAKLFIHSLFALGLLCCVSNALAADIFKHAPCWVTKIDCVKQTYAAIGLSKIKYRKNPQLATAQAQTNAISNLALTAQAEVKSLRFDRKSSRTIDDVKRWQLVSQENATIRSSIRFKKLKFVDKWLDGQGTLYILVVVDQYSDITKTKLGITNLDDKVYEVTDLNGQVIESNMEYAKQLTQNIRSQVQGIMR